ncbi:MAG: polysaccharide biosynthesis/export family protein [Deltaproteobacteria bacterium]|nr:polysaccharide biosynthesis/export family protein [Deltaproteobacteria bacterium]
MMGTKNSTFLWCILILFLVLGCSSSGKPPKADIQPIPPEPQGTPEYRIQPGDELTVKFYYNAELNETIKVRPDGKISLQLVDDVQAAGLTPTELDKHLTEKYSRDLKSPVVAVIVRSFSGQQVYVAGEVAKQGLIDLTSGMTALAAVINAGGFKDSAKPEASLIIRRGKGDRPFPIRVDLEKMLQGSSLGGDTQLQPFDIVYVPKSWVGKANVFVNQYIRNLLMFRGFDLGLWYGLGRAYDD